jgi:hypothetical protein
MNRKEVVCLFKELFEKCPHLEGKSFVLISSGANSASSKDYEIQIRSAIDDATLLCVRGVIKRYRRYAIYEENNVLVIYEPLKPAR